MSPEELEKLTPAIVVFQLVLSLLCLGGMVLLDRGPGWLSLIGFRRARGPREPPLWGLREVLLCLMVWLLSDVFVGSVFLYLAGGLSKSTTTFLSVTCSRAVACVVVFLVVTRLFGQPLSTLGLARTSGWNVFPTVTFASDVFTITSEARVGEVRRTVEAVVNRSTPEDPQLLSWRVR